MGVPIFSDCVFFLKVNSLPLKEKSKLKSSISSNGGAIVFVLNEKCTHVVVIDAATLNSTQQRSIQKHCISVVNPDFIWKSIQGEPLVEVGWQDDGKQCEVILDKGKDKKNISKILNENKENLPERNFKDDQEFVEDGEKCNLLPEDTEVAKYSFFEKDEEVAVVELLCFNENVPYRFKVCTTRGVPSTSQKKATFHQVDTAENACEKYELRINDLKKKGFRQVDKIPPQAEFFASQALQKVLIGEALNVAELPPDVAGFVETFWVDALGHLDSMLSCPVKNISLNDVSKAEGILHQVRNALTKGDREEDIHQMMLEFYRFIPHKEKMLSNIDKKFLTVKQDLCQLIRDMVSVCETSLPKSTLSTTAKYQALRCRIEHVDPNTEEFHRLKRDILDNNHRKDEFKILRVFRIGRLSESTNFKSDLGNVQSLLHASSPCNFVGILSRGLMLPKIIVDEFGWERTDIGNLGSGIYFSNSLSTSVKYADPSTLNGGRLLVVCDVALGKTKHFYKRDYTITEPPSGFHSIHGVRSEGSNNSDFTDDEYVVYDVNQVKMRYIVQFCTNNDDVDSLMDPVFSHLGQTPEDNVSTSETLDDVSLEDLPEAKITKAGLQGTGGQQIPLESIHVKARLMDLAAQVIIFQTYKNNSIFPIEAKYVFPLDSTAAVCGFEAFINGKHIVGEVKEKQEAHHEYKAAIEKGHGAYLMDQDAPDVFTVSVGNLPPKSTVVIKISYVTELTCLYSWITFSIPGTVASWQQDKALKENTQDVVTKVGIESGMAAKGSFCLEMSIEMPRKVQSIMCYTHKLKIKKTDCKAVIQTIENSSLNDAGFSVSVFLEDGYIPRMWVETHPDQDSEACMLIFQPQFEDTYEDVNITICLDCSNSMESCFQSAKLVVLLALNCLYNKPINLILFGSTYKEFYVYPKRQCDDVSEMEKRIKMAKPNMGSTEFWKPLQSLSLLRPSTGCQKVLLISDGHLQNENLVFQILKKNQGHINLFTCGVGATANKHMLRFLAQRGAGAFEYFGDKSKSSWEDQMKKQDRRLHSPACTAVSIKWRQFDRNPPEPVQAPANIQSLFCIDNLLVYGFVPHCTQATLKALINNEELENMVSTTELQKTTGTILHKLTARALIKDYEDGILHEKEHENEMKKQEMKSFIINLSKEHSIVTQFTSFVAVEKRSAEEDMNIEPNVFQIISAEDVDILPYMDWTADGLEEGNYEIYDSVMDYESISSDVLSYESVVEITAPVRFDRRELSAHVESLAPVSPKSFHKCKSPKLRREVSPQRGDLLQSTLDLPRTHVEAPTVSDRSGLFGSAKNIPFGTIRSSLGSQAISADSFAPPVFGLQPQAAQLSAALSSSALDFSGGHSEAPIVAGRSALFGSVKNIPFGPATPSFSPQANSADSFPPPVFGLQSRAFPPPPPPSSRITPAVDFTVPPSTAFSSSTFDLPLGKAQAPTVFGGSAHCDSVEMIPFRPATPSFSPQTNSADSFPPPVFGLQSRAFPPPPPPSSRITPAVDFTVPPSTAFSLSTFDLPLGKAQAPTVFGGSAHCDSVKMIPFRPATPSFSPQANSADSFPPPVFGLQSRAFPPPPPPSSRITPAVDFTVPPSTAFSSSTFDLPLGKAQAPTVFGGSAHCDSVKMIPFRPATPSFSPQANSADSFPPPVFGLQSRAFPPPPPPSSRITPAVDFTVPPSTAFSSSTFDLPLGKAQAPTVFGGSAHCDSVEMIPFRPATPSFSPQANSADSFPPPVFGFQSRAFPPPPPPSSRITPAVDFTVPPSTAFSSSTFDLPRRHVEAPKTVGSSTLFASIKPSEGISYAAFPPPPPPPSSLTPALDLTVTTSPVSLSSTLDLPGGHVEAPKAFGISTRNGSAAKIHFIRSCKLQLRTSSDNMDYIGFAPPPPPPSSIVTPALRFKASMFTSSCLAEDTSYEEDRHKHATNARIRCTKYVDMAERFVVPSWSSLSALQSQDGFWRLTPELGKLLNINVGYLSEVLIKNGISSLGSRGTEEICKLIATLLVLQTIRIYNLLDEIKFKSLMKLDQSLPASLSYPSIKKAIEWAVKTDRQYPGICNRLGLGRDWDHATRQLLGKEPVSATSDLYPAIRH
ncbi:protein mono-ADP-ribosyltransferase PARP4-like isoform X2 [Mixophyes fleayi]|uniref:protein mono-ADP-ribosyltransferase PARP4-like isoform X2 n=1 Tax=Mixophyes fleayi TaxID=3061075 RepID=UPI003F4DD786